MSVSDDGGAISGDDDDGGNDAGHGRNNSASASAGTGTGAGTSSRGKNNATSDGSVRTVAVDRQEQWRSYLPGLFSGLFAVCALPRIHRGAAVQGLGIKPLLPPLHSHLHSSHTWI